MKTRAALTSIAAAALAAAAMLALFSKPDIGFARQSQPVLSAADRPAARRVGRVRNSDPGLELERKSAAVKATGSPALKRGARVPVPAQASSPGESPLPPEAQKLFDAIEAAYEADDVKSALALAEKARLSGEKSVREEMVWTLGWFGKAAMPELMPFLADKDEEIANDALGHFNDMLQEIDNEAERIGAVELVMTRVSSSEILEDVAMEYLGFDDRLAVESLVRVISSGNEAGKSQALETYESVTGAKYTTPEAAARWVEDFAR